VAKDPVCGMDVGEETEAKTEHKGKMYYFCGTFCKEKFENEPEKFTKSEGGCCCSG
jgi:YHS domain-containing protein